MSLTSDQWNPLQYNRFRDQRSQPFHDLLAMVRPKSFALAVDLGCGTGELTHVLHQKLKPERTLGIDSSKKMLEASKAFAGSGLEFLFTDIQTFAPEQSFDLVFSNAALQWVPQHETLFPRLFSWVKPGGQIAVQMPYNFDHPSHRLAREIALRRFPQFFSRAEIEPQVLPVERYAELFFKNGFSKQSCSVRVYDHPMPTGQDVIEWTKGTTLTLFQKKLSPPQFAEFLAEYSGNLLSEIGSGPYFYAFKRVLLWGQRASNVVE